MTPRFKLPGGRALFISALLIACASLPAKAQEFFAAPRDFVIDKACNATRSIRTQAEPTPLDVGQSYAARGVNRRSNPTHAFIRVGNASKWADLTCGHFADGGAPWSGEASNTPPEESKACLPFFDDVDNPVDVAVGGHVDITPPAPTPSAFDDAITTLCGSPGKVVSRDEFKALMRAHPSELRTIRTFTEGQVFADRPKPATDDDYLTDLTDAWFSLAAFDHIFCGEPGTGHRATIGGLHFWARYLELQNEHNACRINNFRQNEVMAGEIYTFGTRMKNAEGKFAQHSTKGYALTMSGEDILKIATRAFEENPTPSTESTGCLLPVTDGGKQFTTVFVRRASGIRTFYPDATPNGPRDQRNPDCKAAIDSGD
jgi:hypothetical protein